MTQGQQKKDATACVIDASNAPGMTAPSAKQSGRLRSAARRTSSNTPRDAYTPLTERIALHSELAQQLLARLAQLLGGGAQERAPWRTNPWFALWREHCSRFVDLDAAESILAGHVNSPAGTRLFLAQSCCRIVLAEFVSLAVGEHAAAASAASLFSWADHVRDDELKTLRGDLRRELDAAGDPAQLGALACSDHLAAIYQETFPAALRHLTGEYYTPSWLVAHCIDRAQQLYSEMDERITILDPAAGSGGFLAHCIARLAGMQLPVPANIVGFDVNPLAVEFCRANTFIAASRARESGTAASFDIDIHLADAVADPTRTDRDAEEAAQRFCPSAAAPAAFLDLLRRYISDGFAATRKADAHVIVGNPPWIAWDGLTRRYRDVLAPQWAGSTLMVNTGWRAKVAAGKTEFSSLFVYRAAQRHAAANAVMAFVLPLSLFQSHLSGAGFRTFRTAAGRHFGLVSLDDFSSVKVFPDAVNRTCVGTFMVDKPQQFPIQYIAWSPASDGAAERCSCVAGLGSPLVETDVSSPIVALTPDHARPAIAAGRSDYRARGGVNTGGANTILWLNVLARGDSVCSVRNVGKSLRSMSPVITAEIENDAVYPLLRGVDMRRWKATPGRSILLLYDPDQPKKALPEDCVRDRLPKAHDFVSRFRAQLEGRKEYQRWGRSGPFYEVYRIGPYTFSPVKVAWQHTGYRGALKASVVDDRGRRPSVPDQKVILIPFDDIEEAHYVCAVLSSSVTAALLDRYLGADASTHIMDYVAVGKFASDNGDHRRLAALSVAAHQAAAEGADVSVIEKEIDGIAARLRRGP